MDRNCTCLKLTKKIGRMTVLQPLYFYCRAMVHCEMQHEMIDMLVQLANYKKSAATNDPTTHCCDDQIEETDGKQDSTLHVQLFDKLRSISNKTKELYSYAKIIVPSLAGAAKDSMEDAMNKIKNVTVQSISIHHIVIAAVSSVSTAVIIIGGKETS
ncbi:MAG: hypothetical protein GY861_08080 [bacterium]|nr:hypothetical protein [bacterium]